MKLVLYGTKDCHLCDKAEQLLVQFASMESGRFEIEYLDIAESDDLENDYGVRIPVLKNCENNSEIDWPFGWIELAKFLN